MRLDILEEFASLAGGCAEFDAYDAGHFTVREGTHADEQRALYATLKESQLCVRCSKAIIAGSQCEGCKVYDRTHVGALRARRATAGECVDCGGHPRDGKSTCETCGAKRAARQAAYEKRKAARQTHPDALHCAITTARGVDQP